MLIGVILGQNYAEQGLMLLSKNILNLHFLLKPIYLWQIIIWLKKIFKSFRNVTKSQSVSIR
jgi:hypothetical protein